MLCSQESVHTYVIHVLGSVPLCWEGVGADPGGFHRGDFASLSTLNLFRNSCECSVHCRALVCSATHAWKSVAQCVRCRKTYQEAGEPSNFAF